MFGSAPSAPPVPPAPVAPAAPAPPPVFGQQKAPGQKPQVKSGAATGQPSFLGAQLQSTAQPKTLLGG